MSEELITKMTSIMQSLTNSIAALAVKNEALEARVAELETKEQARAFQEAHRNDN